MLRCIEIPLSIHLYMQNSFKVLVILVQVVYSATITLSSKVVDPTLRNNKWYQSNILFLTLHASLSEEPIAEIIGLTTARQIWLTFKYAYSNSSIERIQNLKDLYRQLTRGSQSVAEYGKKFKGYCDQLAAFGHPVDPSDQVHWFLCGLGPSFETFSTSIRTSRQTPMFRDLLALSGHGHRPPHCQLYRTEVHYANKCHDLPQCATKATTNESDLENAFHAQCHVTSSSPDWYVDSGATDHVTSSPKNVNYATPNMGQANVTFGNGNNLPVSHIGHTTVNNNIQLCDVLVVPNLTKNLLSISKLTSDDLLDVLFSQPYFYIQDRLTKQVLAQGRCENGLYVLHLGPQALIADSPLKVKASFEL
uniref:Retrovirus-related Pol polyprotein from transposon TNT 1-94-like beta-barrel domain-containing protein n=1 Tax=Tanacetum cinerariifolium TaxID=118510 RepID=A0A6L2M0S8_TANCI|nr:hypothetical protein [Tanacetum cinerariifolium]